MNTRSQPLIHAARSGTGLQQLSVAPNCLWLELMISSKLRKIQLIVAYSCHKVTWGVRKMTNFVLANNKGILGQNLCFLFWWSMLFT